MTRRAAPAGPLRARGVQARQMFAGSLGGRVRRAFPVEADPDVRAPAYKQQAAKDLLWWVDVFYVTADTTTVALTKVPYWKSEDLKLAGEGLFRDLEWTRAGTVITLDPSALAALGEGTAVLTAHYQWLRDAQPAVIEG
ncbi:MAG: hypothetical protein AB7I24_08270 [Candidatus Nanopelagicales bacterium]|jgi:hypothetical protein